jgi:hypothetical protein
MYPQRLAKDTHEFSGVEFAIFWDDNQEEEEEQERQQATKP